MLAFVTVTVPVELRSMRTGVDDAAVTVVVVVAVVGVAGAAVDAEVIVGFAAIESVAVGVAAVPVAAVVAVTGAATAEEMMAAVPSETPPAPLLMPAIWFVPSSEFTVKREPSYGGRA